MIKFDKEVEWILGRPNFWCAPLAGGLRECGKEIPTHAEEEQAAVIYFMLEMYEKHGSNWRDKAREWLKFNKALNSERAKSAPVRETTNRLT